MADLLTTLYNLATLTFVVTGTLNVGLGLTLLDVMRPLRNARLVIMALLANFVIVPVVALLMRHGSAHYDERCLFANCAATIWFLDSPWSRISASRCLSC